MAKDADSSRSLRIKILLLIDTAFFFLELIVGCHVGSLALIADSFHMLNDVCSLLIALYAIKMTGNSKRSHEYSYGWQRAEVLGALINGVFLLALCFSIFLEAIQRVFEPIVLVGSLGLASNVVGLLLFHEHGHGHGGGHSHHGHSHHDHSHSHSHSHVDASPVEPSPEAESADEHTPLLHSASAPSASPMARKLPLARVHPAVPHPAARNNILRAAELQRDNLSHHHSSSRTQPSPKTDTTNTLPAQSMRLLIWLVPRTDGAGNAGKNGWIVYADPAISLVITVIIFTSALPLVRSASLILLQGTPSHVKLDVVQKSLEAIEGVLQVHELHIWSLSELKLVASVHVLIKKQEDFVKISRHIRKTLHQCGIHSSTIQPEILQDEQVQSLRAMSTASPLPSPGRSRPASAAITDLANFIDADGCLQQCDETCAEEACCPPGSMQPRTLQLILPLRKKREAPLSSAFSTCSCIIVIACCPYALFT
ncbi:hypothetical protein H4Q26_011780 [Puccinia striiformis f. sp. tritici PST-130]|nr:hypothetical protein H4Q26_011780 [Puccinia striiformis f. sp. tritici PST-130]